MKVLAMETSTLLGGVAVIQDGKVVAEESSQRQKSHTEIISPFVENTLKAAGLKLEDIDVFAVGQGPGSFTGIRVAANAGKTYAYSFNKPMVTIDSLTLLAEQARESKRPVLAIMNAYKNMVYLGLFDCSGDEPIYLKGPAAIPVRELSQHIDMDVTVVGDGWETYHEYFPENLKSKMHRDSNFSDEPHARTLGLMAEKHAQRGQTLDWKSFIPLYIRASEAEETKKGILITPLK
ncbi:tRNA (adenosine(37)-N6)-threonylcarbamoyltransferase complex dimerization subunit type 1 TsaB [Bdellovibrio sp. SKB1291214]|uniref:tRNA (adenosine(37)-N6)-threonylcarbamoyltransferase complex dimerization subunit type 1 TsaB n=1 Tax=Bdellovibrio sp. SKB1291214 TaxID=1732569 RepID=UPI001594F2ED|nr:tRNA (adenosine(37)-N6)-threonylcarbamoyltransferase complex dimerization subunit type 1 TsaB [Bdellovibrio sp. SKB1291214]UYL10655.1 tRNA (adenosine(37)-N6)-threonylcarbamoyltransferase complex dimerization subunit type 1 TsaB [Bdellovibrio sp. SKB1291214]